MIHATWKFPYALWKRLKPELQNMAVNGIIRRIEEPTGWVHSLVVVKQGGVLQLFIDPKQLNKNIKRECFLLPTWSEIRDHKSQILQEIRYISMILADSLGHWQLQVLDFGNFGRYYFLKLPFGICLVPEVFHGIMSQMLKGLVGVKVFIDDIIIWGNSVIDYQQWLIKLLAITRANNL